MHIILGVLTAVAGIVWALYRLQNSGVDLNSFNPFYWLRRKKWENEVNTRPLHKIESSLESAAVLVVAVVKLDADLTKDTKLKVIELFQSNFNLSEKDATDLFSASAYLLKDSVNYVGEVKHILKNTKSDFTSDQKASLKNMLEISASLENSSVDEKKRLIKAVVQELNSQPIAEKKW